MPTQGEVFPPGGFAGDPDRDQSPAGWDAFFPFAVQEGPLRESDGQPSVYRLLHLPTFDRPTVVLLIDADGWRVVRKQTDGRGGYFPGKLVSEAERGLTAAEVVRFERLVERAGFWELPSFD